MRARRVLGAAAALIAMLATTAAAADEPAYDAARVPGRGLLGAAGPAAGDVVLSGGAGLVFVLPHVTVAGRIGTGYGTSVELRYRNLAVFGHEGRVRLGWGAAIAPGVDLGIAVRGSYMSLAQAGDGTFGIQFADLALGNDLEVGNDLLLTWNRGDRASITASVGPTWTLGGVRYTSYDESGFAFDPGLRSLNAAVQGEWGLSRRVNVFLRLDGMVLLDAKIRPLGFLPTGTVGLAWWV